MVVSPDILTSSLFGWVDRTAYTSCDAKECVCRDSTEVVFVSERWVGMWTGSGVDSPGR